MFVFHFDFHCHCHASSTFAHHTTRQCYRLGGEKIGAVIGVVGHYRRLSTVLISTLNLKPSLTCCTRHADCRHYMCIMCTLTVTRVAVIGFTTFAASTAKTAFNRTDCMATWHSVQVCHAVHQHSWPDMQHMWVLGF